METADNMQTPLLDNSATNESLQKESSSDSNEDDVMHLKRNSVAEATPTPQNYSLYEFRALSASKPNERNAIRTSKYTCLSFFPLNFFHQLTKMANLYFLVICILQMVPPISITGGSPTNLPPLLFVIAVSMVKDFFEDRDRRKSDAEENNSVTHCWREGSWVDIKWSDVKVGDILQIRENEFFPADLTILRTSKDNICFVETKNLDGETNLKHKSAPLETANITESQYGQAQV